MTSLAVHIRSKMFPNGVCAIRDLSLAVRPKEFLAIVGPSGAGKSTLLNLIAGLDADMDGSISMQAGDGDAPQDRDRPRIGFMFQEPRLMPWLSVRQNIDLVLKPYAGMRDAAQRAQGALGALSAQGDARVSHLLELAGLKDFGKMYPGQLSAGMRRRVALLRAFIIEPALLLMDEPFESLDAPTAEQLRGMLIDLWQRTSSTVLFVTHNLAEAISLADRILFFSARPAHVILEYVVPLPRPRPLQSAAVQQIQHQLLSRHPQLLEGVAQPAAMIGGCRAGAG